MTHKITCINITLPDNLTHNVKVKGTILYKGLTFCIHRAVSYDPITGKIEPMQRWNISEYSTGRAVVVKHTGSMVSAMEKFYTVMSPVPEQRLNDTVAGYTKIN
jgi:hypothetical protein